MCHKQLFTLTLVSMVVSLVMFKFKYKYNQFVLPSATEVLYVNANRVDSSSENRVHTNAYVTCIGLGYETNTLAFATCTKLIDLPKLSSKEKTQQINTKSIQKTVDQLYKLIAENNGNTIDGNNTTINEIDYITLNQDRWHKYVYGKFIQPKGINYPILQPSQRQSLYNVMEIIFHSCEQLNLTCFLYQGSLLGSWVHQIIVPWDGDGDVIIDSNNQVNITGKLFLDYINQYKMNYVIQYKSPIFITISAKGDHQPKIDVGFYTKNATHVRTLHSYDETIHKNEDIFPLHVRPFGMLWLPVPHNPYQYFIVKYPQLFNHTNATCFAVDCAVIKDCVGFVYRVPFMGKVLEVLIYGREIVNILVVEEVVQRPSVSYEFSM